MEDAQIVALYWQRRQEAIDATAGKYGAYCHAIARNILGSREDAEECVNDTWLHAWSAMPPQRPARLALFLGKITRSLSLDRWRHRQAEKRGGGETALVLEELAEVVSGRDDVEDQLDRQALLADLQAFLRALSPDRQALFLCRYWYAEPVADIAARRCMTANQMSVTLHRIRGQLKAYLRERGHDL